jgi:hypothetical protein
VPFDDVFIELMRQADMTEETAREQ